MYVSIVLEVGENMSKISSMNNKFKISDFEASHWISDEFQYSQL